MKYLIDTHVIIWLAKDSIELPQHIKELTEHPENDVYICSVSLWEIAIKMNLGKLDLMLPLDKLSLQQMKASRNTMCHGFGDIKRTKGCLSSAKHPFSFPYRRMALQDKCINQQGL